MNSDFKIIKHHVKGQFSVSRCHHNINCQYVDIKCHCQLFMSSVSVNCQFVYVKCQCQLMSSVNVNCQYTDVICQCYCYSGCDMNVPRRPGPGGVGGEEAYDGQTPLHLCCTWGLQYVVVSLLEHEAHINAQVSCITVFTIVNDHGLSGAT